MALDPDSVYDITDLIEGETVVGRVRSITDFGTFLEVGQITGLLHISNMSWEHVDDVEDIVQMDDYVEEKFDLTFEIPNHEQALGLSVMVFTGHTHEECMSGRIEGVRNLLAYADVLVDGPFVRAQIDDSRNWVGSRNQKFIYLTDRYSSEIEVDSRLRRIVEVRSEGDDLFWNGDPHVVRSVLGRQCCDDSARAVCQKERWIGVSNG